MYRAQPLDLLVAAFGKTVVAVDPRTGARVWQQQLAVASTDPIRLWVGVDRVLAQQDLHLSAHAYATGQPLWTIQLPCSANTMLVRHDAIYLGGAGQVMACSHDGRILWHDTFKGYGLAGVALGFPGLAAQHDRRD